MILEVAMDLMQPRLIQRIVDEGIAQLDMSVVTNTGLLMVGLALIGAVGGLGCTVFATLSAQGFGADLRHTLFRKVQSFSFGNLDDLETGQLITRLTNDVTQGQQVVAMLLRIMVRAPFMLLGSLLMAILTSPRLASLLLVLTPLVLVVLIGVISKATPLFGQVQRKLDDLNTVMQENLAGVRVVKAFARAQHEIQRFRTTNDGLMEQTVRAARTVAVAMPFMMLAVNLGAVGAIWFGGLQVTYGTMHLGQIIAFVNYLMRTLMSLMMVSMLVMMTARAQASAERIQEVLDSTPRIESKPDAVTVFAPRGRVAFENVTFSYDGNGSAPVLRDINFVAEPGQTVAILGATGSGKSSLIHLIPRFYDVTGGRVTIDGVDVRDVEKEVLCRDIGIALQETILFSGTIRDNIRYGRLEATDEEIGAAARVAGAHGFIANLEAGYDSEVGEGGQLLSVGQKQLISLARAILAQPEILVMDEATSSVDTLTEGLIQQGMQALMSGRTTFVIAHRLSTIRRADRILFIDGGRIVEMGTHAQLLAAKGRYYRLYAEQFRMEMEQGPHLSALTAPAS